MKNIVFFVYYNKSKKVSEHTKYALKNIRELYDEVVIISNSKLTNEAEKTLKDYSDKLIARENKGFDFAAWRDGMKMIGWNKLEKYSTVTLANDTCYFPLFPIKAVISKFNRDNNIDFWGASIHKASNKGMPRSNKAVPQHLQSYFMTFKKVVVKSNIFQNFWDNVEDFNDVEDVIIKYETKLTSKLSKQGFKYEAIYNPKDYNDKGIINASYQIPGLLIKRKFPFLKIKAVNTNNFDDIINNLNSTKSKYPAKYISVRKRPVKRILDYFINNTHRLFLIIAATASLAFMAITPVGFGGDEASHINRAYHISTGHLFTQELGDFYNGYIPVNLTEASKRGYSIASKARFGSSIKGRQDILVGESQEFQQLVNSPLNPSVTRAEKFSNTNPYNPVMYAGAALGFKLSAILNISVKWSVFLARFFNAIPFFAISCLALFVLRGTKIRWLVFFVLLLPTVMSYVATVNGDPYNIAAVMLFFAVFVKFIYYLKTTASKRLKTLLVSSTAILASAKLLSGILSVLTIFIPSSKFGGRKKKWSMIAGIFILSALITMIPVLFSSENEFNTGTKPQLNWILHHPMGMIGVYANTLFAELPDYINRAVGVMGRNGVFVHPTVITLIVTWLVLLGLWLDKGSKKIAVISFITGITLCLMVMMTLYLADNKPGESIIIGVHGKYLTPFIPFILYGFTALPISVNAKGRYFEYGTLTVSVLALLTSIIMFKLALH